MLIKLKLEKQNDLRKRRSIILLQRRTTGDKRAVVSFDVIKAVLQRVALILKYGFVVHQKYILFNSQFARFSKVAVVVAPHGAASLFINFSPTSACLIELISQDEPLCYANLAYLIDQDYFGVPRKQTYPRMANMTLLTVAITWYISK